MNSSYQAIPQTKNIVLTLNQGFPQAMKSLNLNKASSKS